MGDFDLEVGVLAFEIGDFGLTGELERREESESSIFRLQSSVRLIGVVDLKSIKKG